MNFDFMAAKLKHTSWKLRLGDFLDGKPGLSASEATNHRQCELGRWLYAEGLGKYGSIPEMKQLEVKHQELHGVVKRIVDLKTSGQQRDAEAEFTKIDPTSKQLVALLTAVERGVSLQPQ